jgi:hypothetical protein
MTFMRGMMKPDVEAVELAYRGLLPTEGLHHVQPRDGLLDLAVEGTERDLLPLEEDAGAPRDGPSQEEY